jgi:hypothetical protein
MPNGHQQYTNEMYQKFGYLATWAPNVILKLGDVGVLRDRIFERETTLAELGIPFTTRSDSSPADYEYVSSNTASIKLKAAGEIPSIGSLLSQADAGISISFEEADAIVFQALHCEITSVLGQDKLGKEILSRYEKEDWPKDYVVVTDLVTCKSATILISSGHGGQIEFATKSAVGFSELKIADATLGLHVVSSSKIGTKILAAEGLTPLFKASGIKRRLLRKPKFTRRDESQDQKGGAGLPPTGQSAHAATRFIEVTYDDFD